MEYKLISDEELEKLGLDLDNYKEPLWYFDEEKVEEIYTNYGTADITEDEVEEFIEYFKAFIKVSSDEMDILVDDFTKIVGKVKEIFKER